MNVEPKPIGSVPESLRLFVAVRLPPAWVEALTADQQRLRRRLAGVEAALRWVRPESCHITLVFLGQVAAAQELRLCEALRVTARASAPFALQLAGLGTFGGRLPRVLYREVAGDLAALQSLQGRVVAGVDAEPQAPFRAHITLARVEPRRSVGVRPAAVGEALRAAIAFAPDQRMPVHRVENLSVMASTLQPGGAVYSERCVAPLQVKL